MSKHKFHDETKPSIETAVIAAEERKLAGKPIAQVDVVETPTVEQVKAAGYSDEAAKKIADEQKAKAEAAVPAPEKEPPYLSVISRNAKGFWRCKRHFSTSETKIYLSDLSLEETSALKDEPNLKVKVVE